MELPEDLVGRPFTVQEAVSAGVGARVLRSPELRTRWRGVRADTQTPDDLLATCAAALLVGPAGAVVSHATALRLHGLALSELDGPDIHLTAPRGSTPSRRPGLLVHARRSPPAVTQVSRLTVATPADAWRQVSASLQVEGLVIVGDALCRRRLPLCSPADLAAAVRAQPAGSPGARRAREALALVREGTDSAMETRTRLILVRAGVPEPLVNRPVLDEAGRFIALPDLQVPAARVAIEYDGDVHRTDARTWRRDIERRQRLEDAGWVVVTATADDVLRDPGRLVGRVRRLLSARTPAR